MGLVTYETKDGPKIRLAGFPVLFVLGIGCLLGAVLLYATNTVAGALGACVMLLAAIASLLYGTLGLNRAFKQSKGSAKDVNRVKHWALVTMCVLPINILNVLDGPERLWAFCVGLFAIGVFAGVWVMHFDEMWRRKREQRETA